MTLEGGCSGCAGGYAGHKESALLYSAPGVKGEAISRASPSLMPFFDFAYCYTSGVGFVQV